MLSDFSQARRIQFFTAKDARRDNQPSNPILDRRLRLRPNEGQVKHCIRSSINVLQPDRPGLPWRLWYRKPRRTKKATELGRKGRWNSTNGHAPRTGG